MKSITQNLSVRYAFISFTTHMMFMLFVAFVGRQPVPLEVANSVTYKMVAQNLLEHRVFSRDFSPPYLWEPYRTPGYPLLISFSMKISGDDKLVLIFAAAAAGIASWVAVQMVILLGGNKMS